MNTVAFEVLTLLALGLIYLYFGGHNSAHNGSKTEKRRKKWWESQNKISKKGIKKY
jgi:hypothetical protein